MNQYPVVDLLVKRGTVVSAAVGAVPVLFGLAAVASGASWLFLAGGILTGAIAFLLMKSYVEVVAIIADMLLPK
jgi:hypothetical protein